MEKLYNYSFTPQEVDFLLQMSDKIQVSGVAQQRMLIAIVDKLQKPTNVDEIDKEVYEKLKAKFEAKEEK